MDWTLAKERNADALLRIFLLLSGMVRLTREGGVSTLPRHMHRAVLRMLRPFEAALRRVVIIWAHGLEVSVRAAGLSVAGGGFPRGLGAGAPRFALVESLKRVGLPRVPTAPGHGPRISFFDGFDPVRPTRKPVLPDDPVDAGALCRRLIAARHVLETLPKQALRFARWQARCRAGLLRSTRTRLLRPGRPPGFRARGKREVDAVLDNCHALALYALQPPDTS